MLVDEVELRGSDQTILNSAVVSLIVGAVAEAFGVRPKEILSRSRAEPAATARAVVMTLLLNRGGTLTGIGRVLDRDHGAVYYGRKKVKNLLSYDKRFKSQWSRVKHLGDMEVPLAKDRVYRVHLVADVELPAEGCLSNREITRRAIDMIAGRFVRPKIESLDCEMATT